MAHRVGADGQEGGRLLHVGRSTGRVVLGDLLKSKRKATKVKTMEVMSVAFKLRHCKLNSLPEDLMDRILHMNVMPGFIFLFFIFWFLHFLINNFYPGYTVRVL